MKNIFFIKTLIFLFLTSEFICAEKKINYNKYHAVTVYKNNEKNIINIIERIEEKFYPIIENSKFISDGNKISFKEYLSKFLKIIKSIKKKHGEDIRFSEEKEGFYLTTSNSTKTNNDIELSIFNKANLIKIEFYEELPKFYGEKKTNESILPVDMVNDIAELLNNKVFYKKETETFNGKGSYENFTKILFKFLQK